MSADLVAALMDANADLRVKLGVAEEICKNALKELDRLKVPDEQEWWTRTMELLADRTAPNFVACTFDMGEGRRAVLTFYQPGGKAPEDLVTELKAELAALKGEAK